MQASRRTIGFCGVVALVALALIPIHLVFAIEWLCLWGGSAIFFVGAGRRLPGFVRLPPPASLVDLGIPDAALGGALSNPWYVLILTGTTWACVAAVPLAAPSTPMIGFGIGNALVLVGAAMWLGLRQRGSAAIVRSLVAKPSQGLRRVLGTVEAGGGTMLRETFWFDITGVHHGTAEVESVGGGQVTVATATPTSNTYGFRQEQREPLHIRVDEGTPATLTTHLASWATPPQRLDRSPGIRNGALREPAGMARAFIQQSRAWEREQISAGSRIVALGPWEPGATQLTPTTGEILLFGVEAGCDPLEVLGRELGHRRWPIAVLVLLAALALGASLV